MSVYLCVYMHILFPCMNTFTYGFTYVFAYSILSAYLEREGDTSVACMHIFLPVCLREIGGHVGLCLCIYTYTLCFFEYIFVYICIRICIYVSLFLCRERRPRRSVSLVWLSHSIWLYIHIDSLSM